MICKGSFILKHAQATKCRNVYEDLKVTEKLRNERRSELLLSISSNKATGNDGISIKILKIVAPAVKSMYIK